MGGPADLSELGEPVRRVRELVERELPDLDRRPLRLRRRSPVEWVPMVIVFVVVLAALVVFGALWASRRRSSEVHSVEGYQNALSTLQTMRAKSQPSVRVLDPGNSQSVRVGGESDLGRPRPLTLNDTPPGGLVFDDVSTSPGPTPPRGTTDYRRPDRSMAVMNRRPRRVGGAVVAGLVVVALVAVLLVIGSNGHHHSSPPTSSSGHRTASKSTAATVARSSAQTGATVARSSARTGSGRKARSTTTSTVATQFSPLSSTAFSAQYTPPSASYTLTVAATTGNCWIMVRDAATGTVYVAQTLTPGQQQSVSAQGQSTVQLGAPSVAALTLDGSPVVLPTGARAPFTLTFDPTASTGAVSAQTTTTSSSVAP